MITDGQVVTLAYVLKSAQGDVLDQSDPAQPFAYMHGFGQIVPGLESFLEGKTVGFKGHVDIKAADGYGDEIPEMKIKVDRKQFPADFVPEAGQRVSAQGGPEPIVFLIEKVEDDVVHLNANHPLAGQSLHFDVEVVGTRAATAEEKDHGHVHGAGGHHH